MSLNRCAFGVGALLSFGLLAGVARADFVAGNVVVYRVGEGGASTLLATGAKVFLDEYEPDGDLVQSVELNSTGAELKLIASGTATSEGYLTRSPDGQTLALTGYDAVIPTTGLASTTGATVNRTVALVTASETVSMYGFSDLASGNNPRSAVVDGPKLYMTGGAGGVRYADVSALSAGTTNNTSTQLQTLANNRQVNIFSGQLYASDSSGSGGNTVSLGTIGVGEPTTGGQSFTTLPGFPVVADTNNYAFFFADLDAGVGGDDTLYVADESSLGLTKYSLVSGSWTANGTIGVGSDDYRGVTGTVSGSTVTLYATRLGGGDADGGGELVSVVDASGYNGAFSGTPTILATAAVNTAFRGVALAPIAAVPEPSAVLFGAVCCVVVGVALGGRQLFARRPARS